jgi:dienelactone hydrolase
MKHAILGAAISMMLCLAAMADTQFWVGTATRNGETLPFQIRLNDGKPSTGALDVPSFQQFGLPLFEYQRSGNKLKLSFGTDRVYHLIEGHLKNGRFEGTWHWIVANLSCPFVLEEKPDPRPYTSEEVTFANGEVTLAGTVLSPKTPGPHAAIMMMPGSGDSPRWRLEGYADYFARQGLVALVFDKRGNGASTGDWKRVGFDALAQDGIAGIHLLQQRKDVDPKRVGFWGISQAGWIMPLAASMSPDVAFIVTTSGATVDVKTEGKFDYLVRLRDAGVSDEDIALADKVLEMDHQVTVTGQGYDELRQMILDVRNNPWWKTFDFQLTPLGARAFPKLIAGFDPRPTLEQVDIPILWIYGLADKSVEPSKSIAILNDIMGQKPKPWTIKTFGGADHGMRMPYDAAATFPHSPFAPGYWNTIAAWLNDQGLVN